jgi:hypothetical protein
MAGFTKLGFLDLRFFLFLLMIGFELSFPDSMVNLKNLLDDRVDLFFLRNFLVIGFSHFSFVSIHESASSVAKTIYS